MTGEPRRIPRYLRFRPDGYQDNALTSVVTEAPREQLEQDLLAEQDRALELAGEVSRLRAQLARLIAPARLPSSDGGPGDLEDR